MFKQFLIIPILLFLSGMVFSQLPNWVEQTTGTTQTLTSAHSNSLNPFPGSYVWACGYGGTVLRSTNDGTNWQNTAGNGIPTTTQLINIAALDANTAVTAGYVGSNTFVYRTSNAGANWTQVFTETNGFINAICFMDNSLTGFMMGDPVGGRWSMWKTTNGGINWDSTGMYLPQAGSEAGWNNGIYCLGNRIWFGTNNTKLYYSTNFGNSWTAQPTTGSLNSYAVYFNRLSGGSEGLIGGSDMYRTSNYGANWFLQPSAGSGNFGGITGGIDVITDALTFLYTFAVRGTTAIYASTNDGTNWFTHYTASAGTYRYIGKNFLNNKFWGVRTNGAISYLHIPISGVNPVGSESPENYSLYQNYPNPFNPDTKIKFQIIKTGNVRLTVYDRLGREVASLVNEILQPGVYETDFDASGYASGMYFYRILAEGYSETKSMILIK